MRLKILTKHGLILEAQDVKLLTLETTAGTIQVLAGHQDLITELDLGALVLQDAHGKEQRVAISGGVAQIHKDEINILADDADLPEKIVAAEIEKAVKRAQELIASSSLQPAELIQLEKQLRYQLFKQGLARQ